MSWAEIEICQYIWRGVDLRIKNKKERMGIVSAFLALLLLPEKGKNTNITSHSCKYAQMNSPAMDGQSTDRQTYRQTDRQTDGRTNRQKRALPNEQQVAKKKKSTCHGFSSSCCSAGEDESRGEEEKETGCEQTGCKQRATFHLLQKRLFVISK